MQHFFGWAQCWGLPTGVLGQHMHTVAGSVAVRLLVLIDSSPLGPARSPLVAIDSLHDRDVWILNFNCSRKPQPCLARPQGGPPGGPSPAQPVERPLLAGPGGCWSSLATLGPALSPDPDQELGTTTCASDDQILGGGGLR